MMTKESELFVKALQEDTELNLEQVENLAKLAPVFMTNKLLLMKIAEVYRDKGEGYETKPRIGAAISINFDWEKNVAVIKRLDISVNLPTHLFLKIMGLADVCFSPIYPLGSVLELNLEQLPENARVLFQEEPKGIVIVTGRRIPVFNSYFADYVVRLWPFGEMENVSPILLSNLMIARSIQNGPSTPYEDDFVWTSLREKIIEEKRISLAYFSHAENEKLENAIRGLRKEEGDEQTN